jgi:hypothetical protein
MNKILKRLVRGGPTAIRHPEIELLDPAGPARRVT